ncbi:UNVERIFIED_CONTAM: hypothetical protein Sradi_5259000 [Sesamum radiatum]|uniref:Uncharacterized protein n=1 Tax=Sesamum radiatum TaxID=300843 RepID=A0AAW2LNS0_SESRA
MNGVLNPKIPQAGISIYLMQEASILFVQKTRGLRNHVHLSAGGVTLSSAAGEPSSMELHPPSGLLDLLELRLHAGYGDSQRRITNIEKLPCTSSVPMIIAFKSAASKKNLKFLRPLEVRQPAVP